MKPEEFREKVEQLYALDKPKGCGYGGPFIFTEPIEEVAFYTIVRREGESFRETVYAVWPGEEDGNLCQEEISVLVGFFTTSLSAKKENGNILLNVRCEYGGKIIREFDFRIPSNIIREWCRKERLDKEVIIN